MCNTCLSPVSASPLKWSIKFPFLDTTVERLDSLVTVIPHQCLSLQNAMFIGIVFRASKPEAIFRTPCRPMQFSVLLLGQLVLDMVPQHQGQVVDARQC
jgi:hypothetical protein